MNKFWLLLKKELRELLTPQMLVPFILVMVVFVVIGKVAGKQLENQSTTKDQVLILDLDKSDLSRSALKNVGKISSVVDSTSTDASQIVDEMRTRQIMVALVVPHSFSTEISSGLPAKVKTYSLLQNFNVTVLKKTSTLASVVGTMNDSASNYLISIASPTSAPEKLKNPVVVEDYVSAKGKVVAGNASVVLGYITQQTNFVPVILFIVIVFAAQMIATAVATEKENKTLETLLSLPVSRRAIVTAKMLAAGLVSLLMAGIYMYGLKNFIGGTGSTVSTVGGSSGAQIAQSLGLAFTTSGYLTLGLVLFLGILLALAIAMILGAFAEDAKSAQSVIAPLMALLMIPYFATLLLDISQLSPAIRDILYIIPFSHIFLAAPNILLGNNGFVLWGVLYLFVLFVIFVMIAAKIFSSDLILTMKLNFSKKKS